MHVKDLDLISKVLSVLSISTEEIVLPLSKALEAVDVLESKGIHIFGWEGWIKRSDGRVGHANTPQGTESLDTLSIQEAAELCRKTMLQDAQQWQTENHETKDELYSCITV